MYPLKKKIENILFFVILKKNDGLPPLKYNFKKHFFLFKFDVI